MVSWVNSWKKCLDFSGRTSREEFWSFVMWNLIVWSSVLFWVELIIIGSDGWDIRPEHTINGIIVCSVVYLFLTILPLLSITARRLHDVGKSGWNVMLFFTPPPIGLFVLLYWLIQTGKPSDNEYGRVLCQ